MTPSDIYLVILATLAVPWAGWVSLKLMQLDRDTNRVEARHDSEIEDHEGRIRELERLFPRSIYPPIKETPQ